MRIAIIGRTRILLDTAKLLHEAGFEIPLIYTCKAEAFYQCDENEFAAFAKEIDATYYSDLDINQSERIESIAALDCDIAVSLNWLTILKDPILKAFKHGIWNAHAGDLPRYRGNACPNWAILNGEKRIGLSVHEMLADEVDAGDIIEKRYIEVTDTTYISHIYAWLEKTIPRLFLDNIQKLRQNTLRKTPQSKSSDDILRCYPRQPEDAKINWHCSSEQIHRLIRASSKPFDGAYCYLEDGSQVTIWRVTRAKHHGHLCAIPGQVLYAEAGQPIIACKEGVIQITESTLNASNEDANPIILSSLRNRLL